MELNELELKPQAASGWGRYGDGYVRVSNCGSREMVVVMVVVLGIVQWQLCGGMNTEERNGLKLPAEKRRAQKPKEFNWFIGGATLYCEQLCGCGYWPRTGHAFLTP